MDTKPEDKIRILYVDDEENNLQAFKATFRRDYKIFLAISAKEGVEILKNEEVDIIITDQRWQKKRGWSFWKASYPCTQSQSESSSLATPTFRQSSMQSTKAKFTTTLPNLGKKIT